MSTAATTSWIRSKNSESRLRCRNPRACPQRSKTVFYLVPAAFPRANELLVNLKTARTLGIEVPLSLLIRADELLE